MTQKDLKQIQNELTKELNDAVKSDFGFDIVILSSSNKKHCFQFEVSEILNKQKTEFQLLFSGDFCNNSNASNINRWSASTPLYHFTDLSQYQIRKLKKVVTKYFKDFKHLLIDDDDNK